MSFWSFLTFLHHGLEEVERHLWKFHEKIQRKGWSNVPPKLLTCVGFLYKVVHKNGRLGNSIALGRLNLTFLSLGLSLSNLAHLFIMFMATKGASDLLIFAKGLIGHSHDGQIFDHHGHVHDNRSQSWVVGFTRKRLTIVHVGWLA